MQPDVCAHPSPAHPGQVGTLFSSDANGKVGDTNNGGKVGKQWHEWKEMMSPCLTLRGPLLVYGEREAVCEQNWLCSEGKAAFVCQYGLELGKVSGVLLQECWVQGARSLLLTGREQPVDALQTELCMSAHSNMPGLLSRQMWS